MIPLHKIGPELPFRATIISGCLLAALDPDATFALAAQPGSPVGWGLARITAIKAAIKRVTLDTCSEAKNPLWRAVNKGERPVFLVFPSFAPHLIVWPYFQRA